ncbi:MAG: ribonuclease P protein component [Bacilli bacterium]
MKKEYRIKKAEDFQRIIHSSRFVKNPLFVIYFQPTNLETARVGISIPKRLGIAVKRNKIKRQIKAILHEALDVSKPFDYVIVPRAALSTDNYHKSKEALTSLLVKIGDQNFEKIN